MSRFEQIYQGNTPVWDIGRAQQAFVALADAGKIRGAVLDAGCGTGENALFLASHGHAVTGIDAVPVAIERAREKARARGLDVTFEVADALALGRLGRTFDTIIDSGLFHVFSDEDRARYVESLASVLEPGGVYHVLCFNEHTPGAQGPRRVRQEELKKSFEDGWVIKDISPVTFETTGGYGGGAAAWLASIERTAAR